MNQKRMRSYSNLWPIYLIDILRIKIMWIDIILKTVYWLLFINYWPNSTSQKKSNDKKKTYKYSRKLFIIQKINRMQDKMDMIMDNLDK